MFDHNSMLPYAKLETLAAESKEQFRDAFPFPHIVFDDIFDEALLDRVLHEYENSDQSWKEFESKYEKKLQMSQDQHLSPVTRQLIHNLNSEPFLRFLSEVTGIEGLISDPYLQGGGLHKIPRGGKLGVHIDFNRHGILPLYRRVNVIIYLNKDWPEEYGGELEFWDENKEGCKKKILPIFNRMAIFNTTQKSFHGHPTPLNCPEDRCRRSLALYYFTAEDRGEQTSASHSTVFLDEEGKRDELIPKVSLLRRIKRKLLG